MPIHRRVGATWDGEMSITHRAEIRIPVTHMESYLPSVPWHQTFVEVCGGQVPRTYRFELGHARQRRYGQVISTPKSQWDRVFLRHSAALHLSVQIFKSAVLESKFDHVPQ